MLISGNCNWEYGQMNTLALLYKVAQKRLLLQLSILEKFFWLNQGNRNVVNNQHGDHGCMEGPIKGNAQNKVSKFPILDGKSSQ